MSEVKIRHQDETELPIDQRSHVWFRNCFEERIAKIPHYPEGDDSAVSRFKTDRVDLQPELLTAAILQLFPERESYELLIGDHRNKPGYHWGDHKKILERYNLTDDISTTFMAFYFEAGDNRYLMVNNLDCATHWGNQSDVVKLAKSMKSYGIKTVFSVSPNWDEYHIESGEGNIIDVGNYLEAMDKVIRDNYISGLAMQFDWTNFEMIRFKITGELPEWKRPSYKEESFIENS